MIYLPDIPCGEQQAAFYSSYSRHKRELVPSRVSLVKSWLLWWRNPYVSLLEATGGLVEQTVLDIGCSYGSFLKLVRARGALVRGVELDVHAVRHLRENAIAVSSTVDEGEKVDVICAFHVLEHLVDPRSMIRDVSAVLAEDGRFLLAVPNGNEAVLSGPTWVGYRADLEHLNYFSLKTLASCLSAHGIFVEQYWESSQPGLQRMSGGRSGSIPRILTRIASWPLLMHQPRFSEGGYALVVLGRKVGGGA